MTITITQSPLIPETKKEIFDLFSQHAIEETGIDGLEDPVFFELKNKNDVIGWIVVMKFWGQLHIKYLAIKEDHRGNGYGKKLVDHALHFGATQGCDFAFVETMNFQAPEFYQKCGFHIDFIRNGYAAETSFYYLSRKI